jgi:hypothetical protein
LEERNTKDYLERCPADAPVGPKADFYALHAIMAQHLKRKGATHIAQRPD